MNSVNISGRAGAEVELRYTPSGKAVAQLTLAVDDGWGENKKTAWIGVTLWGATAELAARAIQKGDRVGITGRLSQEEWTDKDGKKQRKTKVICEHMDLYEPKRPSEQSPTRHDQPIRRSPIGMPPAAAPSPATNYDEEEDIPF